MSKVLAGVGVAAALAAGWVGGSVLPVPSTVLASLSPTAFETRVRSQLARFDLAKDAGRLFDAEQWKALSSRAVAEQEQAGRVIVVERLDAAALSEAADAAAPSPEPAAGKSDGALKTGGLCPGMTVSNAPPAATLAAVRAGADTVIVNGVKLSLTPTTDACLSSGFGPRNGRRHEGVDFYSRTGGPVFAAGAGVVREMKYRDDYGNMVLLEHGRGVFTRYAHLAAFDPALKPGATVTAGAKLGLMGNTAGYRIPVHLHWEVLTGNYDTPKKSFGLTAIDPFAQPRS